MGSAAFVQMSSQYKSDDPQGPDAGCLPARGGPITQRPLRASSWWSTKTPSLAPECTAFGGIRPDALATLDNIA